MKELFTLYYHRRILFTDFFSQSLSFLSAMYMCIYLHDYIFLLHLGYHIFSSIASSSSFRPLFSLYALLFTRCATSNASRHFKSPLAMGRDAFKPKHASSVSISEVIDTGVNSNLYATAISPTIPDEVSAP